MVNCIVAGNFSEEQGGGTGNADDGSAPSDSVLDLHNCLLIGNECDTNVTGNLDVGGGHFNRDGGESELAHCTIVGNKAGYQYGGAANVSGGTLLLRNSITWDNTDVDGGSDDIDAQLFYGSGTLHADDADNNIIDHLGGDTRFITVGGDEVNSGADPGFEAGVSSLSWSSPTYDADTGQTTFNGLSGLTVNAHVDKLFKPDTGEHPYLLIVSNTATSITCMGKTADSSATGLIFDPHICECGLSGHAAIDFGDSGHLPADVCDIDGVNGRAEALPWDLYENDRDQGDAPDSGVHEVDPG